MERVIDCPVCYDQDSCFEIFKKNLSLICALIVGL